MGAIRADASSTPGRRMIIEAVRQFRKQLLPAERIRELDQAATFPLDILRTLLSPEIGLQLLFIPEAYGGVRATAQDRIAVCRELSKICLGVATGFLANHLAADPIIVGGTEDQKHRWLGRIARGEALAAYAVTEPEAGSNLAAIRTSAEPQLAFGGKVVGWRINGAKQFISNGGYADFITVLAQAPHGPCFFIVEKDTPGFRAGPGEIKHGIRCSNTVPLYFSDVVVPAENLVGHTPGLGLKQANSVFGYTRLMVAAMAEGAGRAAMDQVLAYARKRVQFNSPLASLRGYTHKLVVPNLVRLEAAGAYIEEVAGRLDAGETGLETEGAIAKLFASETAARAADDAVQALGGYGYMAEFMVEKIRRDVKITCIYEGTSEIQQNIIGLLRWKKTRKTKGEHYGAMARELAAIHSQGPPVGAGLLSCCAEVLNAVIVFVQDHKLTRHQHVMFTLADMIAQIEVGTALARKAVSASANKLPGAEKLGAMSRIFAHAAARQAAEGTHEAILGTGVVAPERGVEFLRQTGYPELVYGLDPVVRDMDLVADMVFHRRQA